MFNSIFGFGKHDDQIDAMRNTSQSISSYQLQNSFNNAQHDLYAAQMNAAQQAQANIAAQQSWRQMYDANGPLLQAIRSDNRRIVAFKEVNTDEELTWAIMEGYEQSITEHNIYFKFAKFNPTK